MDQINPDIAPTYNRKAVISVIIASVTLFILGMIPVVGTIAAIVGIVFGRKGLTEIKQTNELGSGLAISGIVGNTFLSITSSIWTFWVLQIALTFIAAYK